MVQTALFFGADKNVVRKEMIEALKVEMKLAEISLSKAETRNKVLLNNPMTLREVQKLYPDLPWIEYINEILKPAKIIVDEDEVVNIVVPRYISKLLEYIATVPDRVLANYILWRKVNNAMSYLNDKALQISLRLLCN